MEKLRKAEPGRVLRAVMCAFTAATLIAALLAPDRGEMLSGLWRLCVAPAQLTRDYFKPSLGSISGAMLNSFLVGSVFCALLFLPGAKVTGGTVLGFFLTMGFCTFGINIVNILPLLLGTFICSLIRREPFAKHIPHAMFLTGIAPLVTQVLFYYPVFGQAPRLTPTGVLLALVIGIFGGLIMPTLLTQSQNFHKGYNLFNAGPAAGFLCFLIYAVLFRTLGVEAPSLGADLGEGHHAFANAFCISVYALFLIFGLLLGGLRDYGSLLKDPGYRSDFTEKYSVGANIMNLGIYGLLVVLYYNLIGATFTSPTMGVMICMICAGCNGATPRNVFPIVLGYIIMGLLHRAGITATPINSQGLVVGLCFSSGLAPIAGKYGFLAGVVAGILHYCLVTSVPFIHGGFNLYNGGFTSGIVAFIFVPVLEHYFRPGKARD